MSASSPRTIKPKLSRHQIQSHEFRHLSLDDAHTLLAVVRRITAESVQRLQPLQRSLHSMVPADPRQAGVRQEYQAVVRRWAGKIERLGLKAHGLWQVSFDGGEGWYCWQFPERSIRYFLEYDATFEDRTLIRKRLPYDYQQDWVQEI